MRASEHKHSCSVLDMRGRCSKRVTTEQVAAQITNSTPPKSCGPSSVQKSSSGISSSFFRDLKHKRYKRGKKSFFGVKQMAVTKAVLENKRSGEKLVSEEERAIEQGIEDVKQEILDGGSDQAKALLQHQGDQLDKPKFVPYDYGFQAGFLRTSPTVPGNVVKLAFENFGREYKALRQNYLFEEPSDVRTDNVKRSPLQLVLAYTGRGLVNTIKFFDRLLTLYDGLSEIKPPSPLAEEADGLRRKLAELTLSSKAVWDREHARPPIEAPWWILAPYYALCLTLDVLFENRPIQRFWFLETVARMPYFSYISMLHLYETLGWWRVGAEVRKVHFAEEWNEMHHLKIMESLGGDRLWPDRFAAQHAAFFYYWILNVMFLISPKVAYNFSELIEMHAVDTYGTFADENESLLKTLPPSPVAVSYYYGEDLYLFDEFQTSRTPESRRPKIDNLYDVFSAIRDDELEHVKTMSACQQLETVVVSPNRRRPKKVREAVPPRVSDLE